MKNLFSFGVITIILLLVISCRTDNEELNIGVISSLTGTIAPYGQSVLEGIELAKEQINESDGINGQQINLLIEDDQSDTRVAVSAINKLIDIEQVQVIIGPVASSSAMAAAPVAEAKKVVLLLPAAASPNISNAGDYIFRNRASGGLEALTMAELAYNELKLRTAAILYINTDYGVAYQRIIKEKFTQSGGTISQIESFNQGNTSFRSELLKIKKENPECIFLLANPTEAGYLLKQARELGVNSKFIANNVEGDEVLNIAGDAADGLVIVLPFFDPNSSNIKTRNFVDQYKSKYGKIPDLYAANGFDAVYLLKSAIENSENSGEEIKKALYKMKAFEGANGKISFDENGDVIKPLTVKQVVNGKFSIIN